jgi:hypothetical protein
VTRDAYVALVVLTRLEGMGGVITLHAAQGRPALAIVGVAPVYLDRADAVREWPGAVIVPVTIDIPDTEAPAAPEGAPRG